MPGLIKRVPLDGLFDGWDDSCYALVHPSTYEDRKQFRALEGKNDEQSVEFQSELVRSHFVSGKGKTYDATGRLVAYDLSGEDLEVNELNNRLAMEIMGFDPKVLAALPQLPSASDEPKPTATSSSATSAKGSTTDLSKS